MLLNNYNQRHVFKLYTWLIYSFLCSTYFVYCCPHSHSDGKDWEKQVYCMSHCHHCVLVEAVFLVKFGTCCSSHVAYSVWVFLNNNNTNIILKCCEFISIRRSSHNLFFSQKLVFGLASLTPMDGTNYFTKRAVLTP